MMNLRFRWLLLPCVVLLVVGCNATPPKQEITCDALRQPELQAFIRTDPSQTQFTEWVQTEYQSDAVEAVASTSYEDVTWIRWNGEGRAHEAAFKGEALQYVNARLDTTSTTLATTLDCFGEPPFYSARMFSGFEGRKVEMAIWYPEQGIEVGFAPEERQPERVTLSTTYPAYAINYLPTNTLDEGFNILHQFLFDETRAEWYARVKPFPDDIEAVEVTIEP